MANEFRFTCALEHGLHARPASALADALRPFDAHVEMVKESSGKSAEVRSVLSIVALDVAAGDVCVLRAEGEDAEQAIESLRTLIEEAFGEAAGAAAEAAEAGPALSRVPAGLQRLGVKSIPGRGISPGFAQGQVMIVRTLAAGDEAPSQEPAAERALAHRAVHEARQAIAAQLDAAGTDLERDLLRAHVNIAEDPALRDQIDEHLRNGASAAVAVRRAAEFFIHTLRASASQYIRDRVIDVEDVCQQILERLPGRAPGAAIVLREASIIVADLLTPRQMMALDRAKVRALVLGRVGATSHTAILARAFGIPALVDVHDAETSFRDGQLVIVDAEGGFVLPEVSAEVQRYYAIERRMAQRRRARLEPFAAAPAKTRDGARIEVAANVSTSGEVAPAMRDGAEGIGLFRTEMLFLDRPAPPTEDEQFIAYGEAVAAAGGRTIIFRTFDIGGDKPAPYLRLPREENPFLGWRGIRLYQKFGNLLTAQLRAIIRASAKGPVKVMAPMVSNAKEAAWFVQRVRDVQAQLRAEGATFDEAMPIGVMIEVPAAALAIDQLSEVVDFFSIGTNDLCQYALAADRGNARVADLCDPLEPGFLRLMSVIVESARRHRKWVGVCGEMAGEPRNLPIMLGLGVDEISIAAARVLDVKAAISQLDSGACREVLSRAVAARDADAVRSLLAGLTSADAGGALIDSSLVSIGSDARSKVEAIKELTGLIVAAGRAADACALEDAVWAREDTYATGMGFGFAIPHCKSETVRIATIAVLRLREPIDWGAAPGGLTSEPVRMAIMLAIPGGGAEAAKAHMQVLARLARKLMHEDFREHLMQASSADGLVAALTAGLDEGAPSN
jgi:phosphoenolpyruvate-protein phosphotransferase